MTLTPSSLLAMYHEGIRPIRPVATDTETSGLYADDGARVSTASVAWEDPDELFRGLPGLTWKREEFAPDQFANIASIAWPFDQGREGKPEDKGQFQLLPDADNLPMEEWVALLEWLRYTGLDVGLTMHNAKFDLEKYRVGVRRWPGVGLDMHALVTWDTQIVANLLWPLLPDPKSHKPTSSLKPVSRIKFGQEFGDEADQVKAYLRKAKLPSGRWDLMPWDVVGSYADMDARLTVMLRLREEWEIYHAGAADWLHPKGLPDNDPELQGLKAVYDAIKRRFATMQVLYRMEWRGIPYDEAGSREAAMECEKRAKQLAKDLPFRPTDAEAKKFFFEDGTNSKGNECMGLVPYAVTERGAPSMTAEILDRMVADGVQWAKEWAEYNKVTNAASMWYQAYADRMGTDGRLRTCFRQVSRATGESGGTRSTRFSVERVNLQAIPQDYRLSGHAILDGIPTPRDLIASAVPEGWRIWELDLAQAELRVGAMWADCTRMLEMITNDEDLHSFTTEALFGMKRDDPEFFRWRQVGKRGNFSLIFGSGGATFRKMVSKETGIILGEFEADRIVVDWNRLYPEFKRAIDRHMNVVAKRQARFGHGWIDLLTGERRWFEKYEDTHKAFNQRVQGNLAQFGIDWMIWSDHYLRGCGLDEPVPGVGRGGLVLTIHDSQVLLLPDDAEGEAMADACRLYGEHLWKERFPGVPGAVDAKAWSGKAA